MIHSSLLVIKNINYQQGPKKVDKSVKRILHERRLGCFFFFNIIKKKPITDHVSAIRVHRAVVLRSKILR